MIPYYPQPAWHLGPFTIHPFGVLAAVAVLAAFALILRRAPRAGIPVEEMFQFVCVLYLCGLAGGFVAKTIMAEPQAFLADPGRIFRVAIGIRSCGVFLGCFAAGLVWCAFRRLTWYETFRRFEMVACAVPAAFMVGRLGCALAHDHRGVASSSWIAVRFPEGPRYDLGLIEFLFLIPMAAAFWWLGRKPRPVGFFFGLFAVLYGGFRVWLDTLHVEPLRFYEGAIYAAIGLAVWIAMWVRERSRARVTVATPAAV